jgi:hypothetical protein
VGAGDAGVAREQRQRAHSAHRVADQAGQALDAQCTHDMRRGIGAVLHRQVREAQPVRRTVLRVRRGRSGRALAAAQRVDADHEPAPGIDRPAGAEHRLPPAVGGIGRAGGGVGVGRQAGQDQDRVVAGVVEFAPGLVCDARPVQGVAALHRERIRQFDEAGAGRDVLGHRGIVIQRRGR